MDDGRPAVARPEGDVVLGVEAPPDRVPTRSMITLRQFDRIRSVRLRFNRMGSRQPRRRRRNRSQARAPNPVRDQSDLPLPILDRVGATHAHRHHPARRRTGWVRISDPAVARRWQDRATPARLTLVSYDGSQSTSQDLREHLFAGQSVSQRRRPP
ncbi:MAG: hypothetical protein JWM76_1475 [Pseudonocardiales bacterium]|nr:hypothetical protein [Pseudonocardiales bacterium]